VPRVECFDAAAAAAFRPRAAGLHDDDLDRLRRDLEALLDSAAPRSKDGDRSMPSMRVHELAKEFGMTSKELLEKLQEMKIPAKNHASTLVEAYVDKIRKDLGPR
jgi:nicotinamide riboside kinase